MSIVRFSGLPGNPGCPGGPGRPGLVMVPPKQFTQVSPLSPETASKQFRPSLLYRDHSCLSETVSRISYLSDPSLQGNLAPLVVQDALVLQEHKPLLMSILGARATLGHPGIQEHLNDQGDLANLSLVRQVLPSDLDLLGSLVHQARHRHQ